MTPEPNGGVGTAAAAEREAAFACTFCGSATVTDRGRLTLWTGDTLSVVEGVPARVCSGCGETFYGEDVAARVERVQLTGPSGPRPRRTIEAPVYAWDDL